LAIHMHWRRFSMSTIPVKDEKAFDLWLRDRWAEKDKLLEYFTKNGEFPGDAEAVAATTAEANGTLKPGNKETTVVTGVGPYHQLEFLQIFVSVLAVPLVWKVLKLIFWILSFFVRFPGSGQ
jgi:lysocardiolipin and lysophospholipid acyltransferase